jgi:hypothetical protein
VKYFDNMPNQQQVEETYYDNLSKEEWLRLFILVTYLSKN